MVCRKGSMKWKRAMAIVRRQYPSYGLQRRRRIAGSIIGGRTKKKVVAVVKRRKR